MMMPAPEKKDRRKIDIWADDYQQIKRLAEAQSSTIVAVVHDLVMAALPSAPTPDTWTCTACGVALEEPRTAPPWHDDAAWQALACWHTDDCPWVTSRGQQR